MWYRFNPMTYLRPMKWAIQRFFRGYSACDIWGLDHHLAKLISKRLKVFIKNLHGHPSELNSFEEWLEVLNKMIWSFDFVAGDYGYEEDKEFPSDKESEALNKQCQEGLDLFAKYFMTLWD